jgi:hypothetical protein
MYVNVGLDVLVAWDEVELWSADFALCFRCAGLSLAL